MNYKETFQLAQDKGCKLLGEIIKEHRWFDEQQMMAKKKVQKIDESFEYLNLTLIQKWLRDDHKIHIQNSVVPASEGFSKGRWGWIISNMNKIEDLGKGLELYEKERNCDAIPSYEEALLQGINEALKLI